jgi:DNA polymerase III delta subunit
MADKSLLPAYIICGTDVPKVRLALARFKRRVVEESGSDLSLSTVEAPATSGAEVVQLLQTGSFVLGRRAVIITGADKWRVTDRDAVTGYLNDPFPDTTVTLVGEAFSGREALTRAVQKLGGILRYDLPKKHDYGEWVRDQARGVYLKLSAADARHLLHVVGEDPVRLESELRKLADYLGAVTGHPVEAHLDDIDDVCSAGLEAQMWGLTDAVGRRDKAAALKVLEELLAMGGAPRRYGGSGDPTRSILTALVRHVDLLRRVAVLDPETPADKAADLLKVHPFRMRKLLEQRESFGTATVDRATMVLAEADAALVGASKLEPELVLERAVLRLVTC